MIVPNKKDETAVCVNEKVITQNYNRHNYLPVIMVLIFR